MTDVDSLLDELSSMMDSPPKKAGAPRAFAPPRAAPPGGRPGVEEDDIESLLASLGGDDNFASKAASKPAYVPRAACPPAAAPAASSVAQDASYATRCVPSPASASSAACPRARSRGSLRCSKCDFRVLRFEDQKWSSQVDYMFFRNYMPNVAKLQAQLLPQDGVAAHACQCSWCTIDSWGAKVPHDFWFRTNR
jgi:hypothetical protein